jgi:hypothetical protein
MPRIAVLKATPQGHGRFATGERYGMCELASAVQRQRVGDPPTFGTVGDWQGSGRGTARERHGMCESALNVTPRRVGVTTDALEKQYHSTVHGFWPMEFPYCRLGASH